MSLYHFMIISLTDTPLYELEWTPLRQATNTATNPQDTNTSSRHLAQFVIHAALDTLEEAVWENGNLQLKEVDKFNEMKVWGYVTPSSKYSLSKQNAGRRAQINEKIRKKSTDISHE